MNTENEDNDAKILLEERRLLLDERRLLLESSFARKWLPTLVTLMAGLVAGMLSYVQQQNSIQATERARIEAHAKDEHEWGFKVIEMYFSRREYFDLAKNPEQAALNLRVLAAVAPTAVQAVLNAERTRIPAPGGVDDAERLNSLIAVAGVQDALANAKQLDETSEPSLRPSDFTVYVQYPEGGRDSAVRAQSLLVNLGYRVPGIEQIRKAPSRLQVRYYRSGQRSFAGKLAASLGEELDLSAGSDNAILVNSSKQLPSGILEVWLPPPPVCPTEVEQKCEGMVYVSHRGAVSPTNCKDIVVYAREHRVPNSVYFVEITANGHRFPRCSGPEPDYFGIMDQCPFEFNGKKWYATLDSVRDLGNNLYDAGVRIKRDCRSP